jgi:DNA-binding response OmpR family regulator
MGTILFVDDERDLVAGCERLLRRRGWAVTAAATCQGALAALAAGPRPALAIVDLMLPDGDGRAILRAARAMGTPVIVVTAHGSAADRRATLDDGAAGFLAKPFSGDDLLELVRATAGEPPAPVVVRPAPPSPRYHPGIHC